MFFVMRISHKHKFVYIAITKTGSTTVRHLLTKHSDICSKTSKGPFGHHVKSNDLKDTFDSQNWAWDDYYKFTVVRHPVSRLYSMHKYQLKVGSNPPTDYMKLHATKFYQKCVEYVSLCCSFEDAILADRISIPPQANWIISKSTKISLLDKIVRIENIDTELPKIFQHLGLPSDSMTKIPKLNQSPGSDDPLHLLSRSAIDKVNKAYERDFSLLGY
jgi:hypothetical protein